MVNQQFHCGGSFYFISYHGTSVVKQLDLLVVTCSISKDYWSVTKLKSYWFAWQCVCAQGWACWEGKGGCTLVRMNWTKSVLHGSVSLLSMLWSLCCGAASLWGEHSSVRQLDCGKEVGEAPWGGKNYVFNYVSENTVLEWLYGTVENGAVCMRNTNSMAVSQLLFLKPLITFQFLFTVYFKPVCLHGHRVFVLLVNTDGEPAGIG